MTRFIPGQGRKLGQKNKAELKKRLREAEESASVDVLTGLANRRQGEKVFSLLCSQASRDGKSLAFIMVDLDYFKRVNDRYGHSAGDEVLRQLGKILKQSDHRANDFIFRYGGEEFVIVAGVDNVKGAMIVAERIRKSVANHKFVIQDNQKNEHVLECTASLGLVVVNPSDEGCQLEEAKLIADSALYVAKKRGRDCVVYCEPRGSFVVYNKKVQDLVERLQRETQKLKQDAMITNRRKYEKIAILPTANKTLKVVGGVEISTDEVQYLVGKKEFGHQLVPFLKRAAHKRPNMSLRTKTYRF